MKEMNMYNEQSRLWSTPIRSLGLPSYSGPEEVHRTIPLRGIKEYYDALQHSSRYFTRSWNVSVHEA